MPINASDSEPLDLMSYFVDERLMEIAESEDVVQFFRNYMAGFVISKRESTISRCGSKTFNNEPIDVFINDLDYDINDAMCLMLSTTPVVQSESLFADTLARQDIRNSLGCTTFGGDLLSYERMLQCLTQEKDFIRSQYLRPFTAQYPNCNNTILNSTEIRLMLEESTTNFTIIDNSFKVDGAVRQLSDFAMINGEDLVGRLYAPYGGTGLTGLGATVYYNNQVCN